MSLVLVTPPGIPLVTLDQAMAQLHIEETDDATLLQSYIDTAVNDLDGKDGILGRALLTQTWRFTVDDFFCGREWQQRKSGHHMMPRLRLPLPPLQSVTTVTYVDTTGTTQTLDPSTYRVMTDDTPGYIEPVYGQWWPETQRQREAVQITFVCGYGNTAASVPQIIRTHMLLRIAQLYENREAIMVGQTATEQPWAVGALENFRARHLYP
jgi:uncharacterized phiE125 gp8 family phage protein